MQTAHCMIASDADYLSGLPGYAREVLHHAMQLSGYPFTIHHLAKSPRDSQYALRIGERSHPFHLVLLTGSDADRHLHHLVSAAVHIARIWSAPPAHRVAPILTHPTLPHADYRELSHANPSDSARDLHELGTSWYESITGLVTSAPLTLRIEEDIYRTLPEHRTIQEKALACAIEHLDAYIDPRLPLMAPRRCTGALFALANVQVDSLSELTGLKPGPQYRRYHDPSTNRLFRSVAEANALPGFEGDVAITDAWTSLLSLREWYAWARLNVDP